MKTAVYVDGFNLYYAIRQTPYRWLDLGALCHKLLPQDETVLIRYFTARVEDRPANPSQSQRQQVYLRALQTTPRLSIHYGHFLSGTKRMPFSTPLLDLLRVG